MTLQEQFKDLFAKMLPYAKIARKYLVLGTFLLFMTIYIMLVVRINNLSSKEPTDTQVTSELKTVLRPKVDNDTLTRIQQLQDQNIEVKALFEHARQNPFAE
jgi:hypothetical protein